MDRLVLAVGATPPGFVNRMLQQTKPLSCFFCSPIKTYLLTHLNLSLSCSIISSSSFSSSASSKYGDNLESNGTRPGCNCSANIMRNSAFAVSSSSANWGSKVNSGGVRKWDISTMRIVRPQIRVPTPCAHIFFLQPVMNKSLAFSLCLLRTMWWTLLSIPS